MGQNGQALEETTEAVNKVLEEAKIQCDGQPPSTCTPPLSPSEWLGPEAIAEEGDDQFRPVEDHIGSETLERCKEPGYSVESGCQRCTRGRDLAKQCKYCLHGFDPTHNCEVPLKGFDLGSCNFETGCSRCFIGYDPMVGCRQCFQG